MSELEYRKAKSVTTVKYIKEMNSCFAVCPTCGSLLDREYMHFCDFCGQKLSWQNFCKAKIIY